MKDFMRVHISTGVATVMMVFAWIQQHGDFSVAREHMDKMTRLETVLMSTAIESGWLSPRAQTPDQKVFYDAKPLLLPSSAVSFRKAHHQGYDAGAGPHPLGGPPLETCVVVANCLRGAALRPSTGTSFALRPPHTVVGAAAGPRPEPSQAGRARRCDGVPAGLERRRWTGSFGGESRLALPAQLMCFSPSEEWMGSPSLAPGAWPGLIA